MYHFSAALVFSFLLSFHGWAQAPATSPQQLLLKDYRPVSLYRTSNPPVKKAKYPVIDMHSHAYVNGEAEMDQWVKTMDSVGIEKTVIMTYQTGPTFDSLARVFSKYPDRFVLFCGFDYTGYDQPGYGPAAVKELERCVRMGARGIGELGDKGKGLIYSKPVPAPGMHIDDPRMNPLIEKCGALGIPISIHVAEPIWMYAAMDSTNDGLMNAYPWRVNIEPGVLNHTEMIATLENAVKKHPNTTFIACHYANCSYDLNILGKLMDQYGNLYADNAARYAETATIPRFVAKFYQKYQDRIVFGTDMGTLGSMYRIALRIMETEDEHFYEQELFGYHWAVNGYGLPDAVLKKVYYDNARKLLGNFDE